jgi:uncharacterized protein
MDLVNRSSAVRSWSPARPDAIECLQVVYKVVERCNINCTYCYYFNMGDQTALERPARASAEVTQQLADWLAQGCTELRIPRVRISFHGGEPMLIRPKAFARMCATLRERVESVAEVTLSIQTNGTILSEEWLDIFREQRVGVGVSIDGDRVAHDRYRLDHLGRSTFDATESNLKSLVAAAGSDRAQLPSTISVLDHRVDYRGTYAYLRGMGIETMHFLLPDRTADDVTFGSSKLPAEYGERLFEIFHAWFAEDNPEIRIRFIDETLQNFVLGTEPGPVPRRRKAVQVLIARSDGTITVDDTYIPALWWYSSSPVYSMTDASLRSVLSHPIFAEIDSLLQELPTGCADCRWRSMCRGGDLENRYSRAAGFNNPSIYCESYKVLYGRVCALLGRQGYPVHEISRRFGELSASVLP